MPWQTRPRAVTEMNDGERVPVGVAFSVDGIHERNDPAKYVAISGETRVYPLDPERTLNILHDRVVVTRNAHGTVSIEESTLNWAGEGPFICGGILDRRTVWSID